MAHNITSNCIGCGICKKLCPVSAITGELKSLHTIKATRCIDCGVCGMSCPKEAINNQVGETVKRKPRALWAKPVVNQKLCTACSICVDMCGKNSLEISMPKTKGDFKVYAVLAHDKTCVSCGVCEKECPMQAINMEVKQ